MTVRAGRMLGRYRLEASLGKGGMAEVFRATDTRLVRAVAVKVILPAYASEPEFMSRFRLEARLVAALEHPNVLPVYDFGEEDGLPYLVMPFVAGGTLADRLATGPVPLGQALRWIEGLAGALDAAHRAGILHRDVKPQNVLLGAGDRALLADFGIAKMGGATRLTSTGVVVGTPHYMAPELARGGAATAATDLYALAVLAFELLTGVPPFDGENALSVLHQHVHTPPPRPTSKAIHLPRGLDEVLQRALAKAPAERPRSGADFAADLVRATGAVVADVGPGSGTAAATVASLPTARTAPLGSPTTRARPTARAPAPAPDPSAGRGAWGPLALAGVAGLLVWFAVSRWTPPAAGPSRAASDARPGAETLAPPAGGPAIPAPGAAGAARQAAPRLEDPRAAPAAGPAVEPPDVAGATHEATPRAGATPVPAPAPAGAGAVETPAESAALDRAEEAPPVADGWPSAARFRRSLVGDVPVMRRLGREDFEALAAEPAGRPGIAELARIYGRGGLAYLDGAEAQAESALRTVLSNSSSIPFLEISLLAVLRAEAARGLERWHVALGYTDARREAASLLAAARAAAPDDVSAQVGEAVLSHLDGDHRGAAAQAEQAYRREPRTRLAIFAGQESELAGDRPGALRWYQTAANGVGMDAALAAHQGARVARELGQMALAFALADRACDQGLKIACGRRLGARRGRIPGG